jgi:GNAT superfamily N-acetyltransferase
MTSLDFELLSDKALESANAVYAAIAFQASDPERDLTYGLAGSQGELVALGRIQRHADGALEVGGFWVRDDQRGRGIARRLVAHVLAALPRGTVAWCVPFEHLADFYASFGMERVEDLTQAPASLRDKLDFCASRKSEGVHHRTLLLRIDPGDANRTR